MELVKDSLEVDARGDREYVGTLIRRAGKVRYEHDPQGRVILRQQKRLSDKPRTWHYNWDADDQLTGITTPEGERWRYRYDALGRRIAKEHVAVDGASIVERVDFIWDGTVLAEQTRTGGRSGEDGTTVWEWDPATFRPITQTERIARHGTPQQRIDEEFYAIVTDLVGTPAELLDSEGNVAWHSRAALWGTLVAQERSAASTPLRFPGQYYDPESDLNYNYFRYYEPAAQRYDSSDPAGLAGGVNPHAYVLNPTVWIDPLGLMGCEDAAKDIASKAWQTVEHSRLSKRYGAGGVRELPDGRFRYYGKLRSAQKPGEMTGARLVREWNPASGRRRTWYETLDHAGRVRQVHPKQPSSPYHYRFDEYGNYAGRWE